MFESTLVKNSIIVIFHLRLRGFCVSEPFIIHTKRQTSRMKIHAFENIPKISRSLLLIVTSLSTDLAVLWKQYSKSEERKKQYFLK